MKKLLFIIFGLSFLAAACNSNPKPAATSPVVSNPSPVLQKQVFENDFMKFVIPNGWIATEATKQVRANGISKKVPNPAAVNITKGNYILYINTQAQQASGVEGGRFAEAAMGAPSADAVVPVEPSPPCGTAETNAAFANHPRVDLFVSAKDKSDFCNVPSNGKTVWYFSYITDQKAGGYFNYYVKNQAKAFVITMAYNSKNPNNFPEKGSSDLKEALNEMTGIVKSLEIKQK